MTRAAGGVLANRYEVEALLGRGGMGEVFRARDRSLGELVAVKSIVLEGCSDGGDALRRFREEVRLARRVTHRNVARVFDLVEDADGGVFLTMELIDGLTLKALLEREPSIDRHRAARIGADLCAGLSAIHEAGIIHRDLKPTNILVEEGGRAVITDFGVARSTRDPTSLGLGVIVGTPRYMAPEQAEGKAVTARADIYALGVTLSEMFSGRGRPTTRVERLAGAALPPELEAILRACVAHEPEGRPTAAEVGRVLAIVADRAPGAPAADPRPAASEATWSGPQRIDPTLSASSKRRTETSLVVLSFRELGPPGPGALGEVVADELTDVLSATVGVRVLAAGAAARFKDDRDPIRVGRELSVTAVIDGTIRVVGEQIRMGVRLIDAASASQLWAESFEGSLGDLFSFEGVVAKRVAEQLRAHVSLLPYDGVASAEAVRCYLDARAACRTPAGIDEALRLLGRAVELAPDLCPALAAHASTSMIAWFVPFSSAGVDWEPTCASRVERALAGAPGLAETYVAEGLLAWERGRAVDAVSSLRKAIRLAPTCGEALALLGELYCRAGRRANGLSQARLAWTLDPTRFDAVVMLAREEAFLGRLSEAIALLDTLGDVYAPPAFLLRIRAASWFDDEAALRASVARAWALADSGGPVAFGVVVARALLGEDEEGAMPQLTDTMLAMGKSPRLCAEVLAISVEVEAKRGRVDSGLAYLERLAAIPAFVDVDWLERCPALAGLRETPRFRLAVDASRERVRSIAP